MGWTEQEVDFELLFPSQNGNQFPHALYVCGEEGWQLNMLYLGCHIGLLVMEEEKWKIPLKRTQSM